MTGWRLGYGGGPTDIMREVRKLQSQSTSCVSSISQAGAVAALEGPQGSLAANRQAFRRRRDMLMPLLAETGLSCRKPDGAFYVMAGCSDYLGTKLSAGMAIENDVDLAKVILEEAGVATVPGTVFGAPGFLRLSYAVDDEKLKQAVERIAGLCRSLTR
ncbi:aminotransferase class I/II-fold pyridoxal phosphate-dependent enzyme [Breoghania sp.]|uniref:aminotransferase class I/II-fold pyridoxal phosphate-dependent enzyme n=1 Tax=Breoghania sp. TaxID=2065378 RepID=UPI003204BA55